MNRFLRCLPLIVFLAGCQTVQPAMLSPVMPGPAVRQPTFAQQPVLPQRPQVARLTLQDVTPARVAALLPPAPPAGLTEDDDGDVTASFIGWWGDSGRKRALAAFSKEEGRAVTWHDDPRGHALLLNLDSVQDAAQAVAMALDPSVVRTPVTKFAIPNDAGKHVVRHLKLFRRQNVVDLKCRDLSFFRVTAQGREPGAINVGYIAAARKGQEIFVSLYKPGGQLLVAAAGLTSQMAAPVPTPTPAPQDPGYGDPADPGYPGYGDPGNPGYGNPGYPGYGNPGYGGPGYSY